jgi:hypothetical protein
MPRRSKPSFVPATKFKVTKLARSGPKPGQKVSDWESGKKLADARWDRKRNLNIDKII